MNEWTGSVSFPTGVVLAPYKPKLNETDTGKLKGVSGATSIWATGVLRTERSTEDWFREYENSITRPVPTQILLLTITLKKHGYFNNKPTERGAKVENSRYQEAPQHSLELGVLYQKWRIER